MATVQISEAEWQVMNLLWHQQPLTAQEVIAALGEKNGWAVSTVKTMLHRLVKKGVLRFDQQGTRYVYSPRVRRADCVRDESRSFLKRVFAGEPATLLAHFLKTSRLSADEIADLRRILDQQEERS
ncbi:MAG: BlaI/MecI/CopY family transcriptional regulator [Pirellulaceae bacterium]|nr:BlaI/MecI/CopY family transcriptional regulator [Pirellulaceae bacterium]